MYAKPSDEIVSLFSGDTCVVGSFYGPSDVRISKELPHRAAVDVFYRPKVTGSGRMAQEIGLGEPGKKMRC